MHVHACVCVHRRVIVRRADAERKINIEFTSRLRIHVGRETVASRRLSLPLPPFLFPPYRTVDAQSGCNRIRTIVKPEINQNIPIVSTRYEPHRGKREYAREMRKSRKIREIPFPSRKQGINPEILI